jgi:hypothetical protein
MQTHPRTALLLRTRTYYPLFQRLNAPGGIIKQRNVPAPHPFGTHPARGTVSLLTAMVRISDAVLVAVEPIQPSVIGEPRLPESAG